MWIILLVFALLLILFGGGCTLILGGIGVTDPSSLFNDMSTVLGIWLPLGLLPLAAGIFLFRLALKLKRKREAERMPPP